MTAGPWKLVRLEVSFAQIDDVLIKYDVAEDLSIVNGYVLVNVEGEADEVRLSVRFRGTEELTVQEGPEDVNWAHRVKVSSEEAFERCVESRFPLPNLGASTSLYTYLYT